MTTIEEKRATALKIREAIRQFPNKTNEEIAQLFDDSITKRNVRANRAHVTMGTDNKVKITKPTPVAKVKKVKTKKKTRKTKSYDGIGKMKARTKKINAILNGNKEGLVLTLCGKSLIMENTIFSKGETNFTYDLVENDRKVLNQILVNASKSLIKINSINHTDMSTMIFNANTDKYSHLILDYCDTLNRNLVEIETALRNNIVKVNGTVCMTLSTRGVQPVVAVKKLVEGEPKNLTGAKKYFSKFTNYEIIEDFTYKDGMPMMVIILKRIK